MKMMEKKKRKTTYENKRKKAAILFILPTAIVLVFFIVLPIIYGFSISLRKYNVAMPKNMRSFCGFSNYIKAFQNKDFLNSLSWTFEFVAVSVSGTVLLSLALALILNSPRVKGGIGRLIKTIFILPMMLCPVIVSNIWYIIFAPTYGLINSALARIGVDTISFFGESFWARFALFITEFWLATPYVMIILLAALSTVPNDMIEAAKLEGASKIQLLFHVTLPSISSFMILVVSIRLMDALRMFDLSFALTKGGPSKTTQTISYYIYQTGFQNLQVGDASAAAFILLIIIALITFIFISLTNRFNYLDE